MAINYKTAGVVQPSAPAPQMPVAPQPQQAPQPAPMPQPALQQPTGMLQQPNGEPIVPDIETMDKDTLRILRSKWLARVQQNDYSIIEGTLLFRSYLSHPMTDAEFRSENERRRALGMRERMAPGYSVTLNDVKIVPGPDGFTAADYVNMTYLYKRKFDPRYNPEPKPCYEIFSTAKRGPWITMLDEDGAFTQIWPSKQPASGVRVRLLISFYSSKQEPNRMNRSLQGVMILDSDQNRVFADAGSAIERDRERLLAERGIVIKPTRNPAEAPTVYEPGSPEAIAMAETVMPMNETILQGYNAPAQQPDTLSYI